MNEPIISVSGLRGIVGETLTPLVTARYIAAFSSTRGPGSIVVARDGRQSGPMLAQIVSSTLAACGRKIHYAHVAATPTLGVLVRALEAAGGIQISASHNPPSYNGFKLFGENGRVLTAEAGEMVREAYRAETATWARHDRLGRVRDVKDTTSAHLRKILATVDVNTIRARRFRVLLDSNAGAGGVLGRELLSALGCEVNHLCPDPTGRFEHPPEPTEENLREVAQQVAATKCEIGFCQDPDGDRLAIIDENGNYIGEEYTLAICVNHILRTEPGPIVTNCATSRMSEDLARKYNAPFRRSAVGEANVVEKMVEVGAVFGGEGNGGPIDPQVGFVRDSFVGMAQVLDAMASRKMKVSELAAELPSYKIVKRTAPLPSSMLTAAFVALKKRFPEARSDNLDGLRLDWFDRWLIIRGSNTEPIVRVIAEAPSAADAEELANLALDALPK